MRHIPRANATVATIGSPSGTLATASAMPVSTINSISLPTAMPAAITMTATTRVPQISRWPNSSSRLSSGVASSSASSTREEMRPSSVRIPVATTTPSPAPRVTAVPLNTTLDRSASGASSSTGSTRLATGTDSPVSADSLTCRFDASIRRRSAVTTSPPASKTISPGTSFSAGICRTRPSRRTFASTLPMRCSASIERTARSSVTKPIAALMMITTATAAPSTHSAKANDRAAATTSRSTIRLLNCSTRMRQAPLLSALRRRLDPCRLRRLLTSAGLSPSSRETPSASRTSRPGRAHG